MFPPILLHMVQGQQVSFKQRGFYKGFANTTCSSSAAHLWERPSRLWGGYYRLPDSSQDLLIALFLGSRRMLSPINGIFFWGLIIMFTNLELRSGYAFFPLLLMSESLHPPSWLLVESLCSYNWKFTRIPLLCVIMCFLTSWWITLYATSALLESFIWACFLSRSLFFLS